jgi:hypothetical protein
LCRPSLERANFAKPNLEKFKMDNKTGNYSAPIEVQLELAMK